MKGSILWRTILAIASYATLVTLAGFAFYFMRLGAERGLAPRYAYALCGPSLALFTHMSVVLFAQQSLLLIQWLLFGAAYPRFIKPLFVGFALTGSASDGICTTCFEW
jgi:hypothetical protein